MSDDLATTTSPRGLRRRLVRHYVPLALASTAALALFMNLSFFDANRYPPPEDIFAEAAKGALPDGDYPPEGSSDRSQHAGGAPGGQQHDGATPTTVPSSPGVPGGPGSPGSPSGPGGPGDPSGSGGAHTGPPAGGHGGGQTGPPTTQPDKGQAGATPTEPRHAGNQDSVLLMRRYSTATGYVATALLALTLLIGPANLVLRRRNPISGYFRRDVGIWTAITSVVHVVFGFLVKHGDGQVLGYFFQPGDRTRVLTNSFGLANWAGLAAVLIVAGLAVISSDAALRKLRARRWKRLQRLNYALFALVVFHAMAYGALWRTTSPYTVLLALTLTGVITAQAIGVRLWRQRHNPAPAIA